MTTGARRLALGLLWLAISFTLGAEAGDSAVFGTLHPYGPSFAGGDDARHGLLWEGIETQMLLLWALGLPSFLGPRRLVLAYLLGLIALQAFFILQVDDRLLWTTGPLMLLAPEAAFAALYHAQLKSATAPDPP